VVFFFAVVRTDDRSLSERNTSLRVGVRRGLSAIIACRGR